jgi:hypothetical protein
VTVLTAPSSTATIDLPEDLVERYEQAGWVRAEKPKTGPRKPAEK